MSNREGFDVFEAIGLTAVDECVYRAVLDRADDDRLAARSGVSDAQLERSLTRLAELRLIRRTLDGVAGYEVAPPDLALTAIIAEQQAAVRRMQQLADDLVVQLRDGSQHIDPERIVETSTPGEASRRLRDMVEFASEDVLIVDDTFVGSLFDADAHCELRRIGERGVRLRVLSAPRSIASDSRWPAGSLRMTAAALPGFIVVDQRRALVPLRSPDGPDAVTVLHSSSLLTALISLFDVCWSDALSPEEFTAVSRRAAEPTPEDRELLRLLADGAKDEAIARQLGLGIRTTGRRIADLLERLGATSRFQAGLQAQRRGWL